MPFNFEKTNIEGVIIVTPKVFKDDRGFFLESYKKSDFKLNGIDFDFTQDNHSLSTKATLRGLHYQLDPKAQGKLVRCIKGEIFDVAVDIRKSSPTFGKWVGINLSEDNKKLLYVPEGFAHGFYTISENAEILYKATNEYSPQHDRGIMWNDPTIAIKWPEGEKLLSDKDKVHPELNAAEVFK